MPLSDKQIRLHRLKGAISGIETGIKLLRSGYRFEDSQGQALISELENAIDQLKSESQKLQVEWAEQPARL